MIRTVKKAIQVALLGVFLLSLQPTDARSSALPARDILVSGGEDASGTVLDSVDIFDPTTLSFSVGPTMASPRIFHVEAPLNGRFILFAGGLGAANATTSLNDAQLFDRTTGSFIPTGAMSVPIRTMQSRSNTSRAAS